jgi:hypothetical protein
MHTSQKVSYVVMIIDVLLNPLGMLLLVHIQSTVRFIDVPVHPIQL